MLLTGTPLQNNLLELMSLLIFTMPQLFQGKTADIKNMFVTNSKDESEEKSNYEQDKINHAKKIMKPFILRRLKDDVLKQLPKKAVEFKTVPMITAQRKIYSMLIKQYSREVNSSVNIEEDEFEDIEPTMNCMKRGAGMLMNLRKAANHPLLIRTRFTDTKLKKMAKLLLQEPQYAEDGNENYIFEDMQMHNDYEMHGLCLKFPSIEKFALPDDVILKSGKFELFDAMLPKLKEKGERVLIFSQFTMVLDIVEDYMRIRGHNYTRLDGSTKVSDRLDLIDDFNHTESETFVFLLSTKAGGMGINLTSATNVFIHDIDFNPYNDKQAEDRCHRVGQTKEVFVYKMISENSIEEGMLEIANKKLKLGEDLCDSGRGKLIFMLFALELYQPEFLCSYRQEGCAKGHEIASSTSAWCLIGF